ncbi:MAG TPA: DUF2029 domain-containing protein [Chloroflexi bacterium]|nr:DUF2029 domain-containing protein [Chloroflexota bacterium]
MTLERLNSSLNRRRLRYAWLAGGLLWGAWLLSLFLGPGYLDLAGQPVGADYLQFYAAGRTLLLGDGGRLYDIAYQSQVQQAIIGDGLTAYHAFITPPFLAWLFVPFALLSYGLSFALWSLLGGVALWLSLRWLSQTQSDVYFRWAWTWLPVFTAVSYGQNSLLSLLLLTATYRLWRDERPWLAGLVCSGLVYKPQLTLGIGLLWLLGWRKNWRALLGFGMGSLTLAALSFAFLPEASWAYVAFARNVMPILPSWAQFPLWHLHTVRGFWQLLLPTQPAWADVLSVVVGAVGVVGFLHFWRRERQNCPLLFAGAVGLTFWVTPHAMIYDWVLLLIPAVLLWEACTAPRDFLRPLYALVWVACFLGDPLTYLLWQRWQWAFQFTVPVLLWGMVETVRRLENGKRYDKCHP